MKCLLLSVSEASLMFWLNVCIVGEVLVKCSLSVGEGIHLVYVKCPWSVGEVFIKCRCSV